MEERRKQYIQSHLELMGLTQEVQVVEHIHKELPEYLRAIDIAKEYGKYYRAQSARYCGEVNELVAILAK